MATQLHLQQASSSSAWRPSGPYPFSCLGRSDFSRRALHFTVANRSQQHRRPAYQYQCGYLLPSLPHDKLSVCITHTDMHCTTKINAQPCGSNRLRHPYLDRQRHSGVSDRFPARAHPQPSSSSSDGSSSSTDSSQPSLATIPSNSLQPASASVSTNAPSSSSTIAAIDAVTSSAEGTSAQSTSSTSTSDLVTGAAATAASAGTDAGLPPTVVAGLAALSGFVTMLTGVIRRLFGWVGSAREWLSDSHLATLRKASDEDPQNADKHAAYLAELNRVRPREVVARVDSRKYASNPAVVVEYMRAMVASGKVAEFAAPNATPGAAEDHKSLPQLLRELQALAAGEQPDDSPGASQRRPLHVTLANGYTQTTRKPMGPLQFIWNMLGIMFTISIISVLWVFGNNAFRSFGISAGAGTTVAASGTSSTTGAAAGSGGASGLALDPKEYRKEDMPEKNVRTFKDVKGCDEAKAELQEVVEFLKNPGKFTRLGAKLPKGVLLTGPPGTGKTLLAKATAGEAGVPFFYRAGSEFEELYVGVGSRRMRALFQAAKKKAPCIVFIDEIDAIGGNRKHWENHTRKTLNQLLTEMDGFESSEGVIVMAATNLAESLDPALKRPGRFDRQVAVPLPDIKGRQEILEYYLAEKPLAADVDRDLLARTTQGFSGADLANLINEAAIQAAKLNSDVINAEMIDYAFDKVQMGVERKSVRRTLEARTHTAYHEAGHTLVSMLTPGAQKVRKATIIPRGSALGFMAPVGREDEFSLTRQQMTAQIDVCMGGTVAEEVVFGRDQVGGGATSDLEKATWYARHMVAECGLNDTIGPMAVHDTRNLSEDLKQRIDAEVRQILVESKARVKELLTDRLEQLHAVAQALLARETLDAEQIQVLVSGGELGPSDGSAGEQGGSGADVKAGEGAEEADAEPAAVAEEKQLQVAGAGGGADETSQ